MRRALRLSFLVALPIGAITATSRAEPPPPTCPAGMVLVHGGKASIGVAGDDDALPPSTVDVPDYCIDRTEVTVARFRECVAAGRCAPAETKVLFPGFGPPEPMRSDLSRYCNAGRADGADHPINCVDHEAAAAYCAFRGARLPTEIEWEYAARGPTGAPFPWGDRAPITGNVESPLCWDRRASKQGTCAVGAFPAGATRDGALDMAGNVWEWTSGKIGEGDVVRGGGWTNFLPRFVKPTYRWPVTRATRLNCIGFRCATASRP